MPLPDGPNLENIDIPPPLREFARQAIKKAIMDNSLVPGVIYNERALADELGISKTPVHEALLDLGTRGFVTLLPRRGFRVNALTARDIKDLYEFRRAIETAIVEHITAGLSDQDLDHIAAAHHKALKATKKNDLLGYMKCDRELHYLLASLSHNSYMISALENVRDLIDWMGMKALLRKERIHEVNQEHLQLIKLLQKRDVSGAVESMARHIILTEQNVLARVGRQAGKEG